ncbi:MAG: peptidoglycan-binding protein [Pseudomonadota bacterium]
MPPLHATAVRTSTSPVRASTGQEHRVQRGETLSAIARQHGVSVGEMMAANPQLRDPNRIVAGQVLEVPARSAAQPRLELVEGGQNPTLRDDARPAVSSGERVPVGSNGGLSSDTIRSRIESAAPAVASTQASTASQPTLRQGAKGAAVKTLQQKLKNAGFNPGAVDGDFGPRTRAAVLAFQRSRGISADGVVGPQTWGKLNGTSGSSGTSGSTSTGGSGPVMRQGARGEPVRKLQQRLKDLGFNPGGVDGDFGPNTRAAVVAFQRSRGISADGVVGPQTWNKLGIHVSGSVGGTTGPTGVPGAGASNAAKLDYAKRRAVQMGLRITSTTGGTHAPGSYHYSGRAVDVAGSPSQMAAFYREMRSMNPTEMFYDPLGGVKYGRDIGAIGGHRDHVHIAF